MFGAQTKDALTQYEERAFARYFIYDIHFPLIAMTLLSLVSAWLMYGKVPLSAIVTWVVMAAVSNLLREGFVRYMKPRLEPQQTVLFRTSARSSGGCRSATGRSSTGSRTAK